MSETDPAPGRTNPRRTRLLAAIALVVTFASGLLIGAAGDRIFLFRHRRLVPPNIMNLGVKSVAGHLDRELHLSRAQRERIEQILEKRRLRIMAIWSGVHPQVRGEVEATNAEIEAVLTPEQRPRYDQLRMRFERRAHDLMAPPPPPND
jgi:hypothetical protein